MTIELEEAFDIEQVPNKASKPAELFLGRMQPIHLGHLKIIKKMKNPVVALVKGAKSSLDKNRNPLSSSDQMRLLQKAMPGLKVVEVAPGYLPEIMANLRLLGLEIGAIYAGEDRIKGYKAQIDGVNKKLDTAKQFKTRFKMTERFTSATKVRELIRAGDEAAFKKLMPKELHSEFGFLQKKLKA